MATTFDVLYLGQLAIIDTVEGNVTSENAAALTGLTIGTAGEPLAGYQQRFSRVSTAGGDPNTYEANNNIANDTFSIDGGAAQIYDIETRYNGTITYTDGTTSTQNFSIIQDVNGNTYLFPDVSQTAAQDALEAKPIQSFAFGTPVDSWSAGADRDAPNYTDGSIVQGTTGNDTMGNGYADSDGDQISSGSNTIYGDAGNDSIDGGSGNDTIYGGTGNDTIVGNTDNDTLFGGTGDDKLYGGAGADFTDGGAGNDTVYGGIGDDMLSGGAGNDTLFGEDGNDYVGGSDGNDVLDGGAGNDLIVGDGNAFYPTLMPSQSGGVATNLTIVNAADGPIDLYRIETNGGLTYVRTITAGQTAVVKTDTGRNFALRDPVGGYYVDTITGGANKTHTFGLNTQDTLIGGAGNDTLVGQFGDDSLDGGTGNDRLFGGTGNDRIAGGAGADTIDGGTGSDTLDYSGNTSSFTVNLQTNVVSGGDATGDVLSNLENVRGTNFGDTITLSERSGTIWAGSGADALSGGANDDLIYAGAGDDQIEAGGGNDTVYGGDGNDSLAGGQGNDALFGGADDDLLILQQGDDSAYGGTGSDIFDVYDTAGTLNIIGGEDPGDTDRDTLRFTDVNGDGVVVTFTGNEAGTFTFNGTATQGTFAEIEWIDASGGNDLIDASATWQGQTLSGFTGNDTVIGGSGNDDLNGDVGNDTLDGGQGDDYLAGGQGDDTLLGGAGNDTLVGGAGDDTFALDRGGGDDVVTDFDLTDTDGDGFFNDQLDVSDLRTPDGNPVTAFDVNVVDDGSGNAKLIFPDGETIVLQGVAPSQMATASQRYRAGIPCFTPGTAILTAQGLRAVEDLRPGDLVQTRDNGLQPIVWVGMRRLTTDDLTAQPNLRPVRIAPGAFGNDAALIVSPQHGILMQGARGQGTQLVRAAHLARMQGGQARVMQGARTVTYIHLLCEAHQIIMSNGLPTESFYPGPQALAMMQPPEMSELLTLFPDLSGGVAAAFGARARPVARWGSLPPRLCAIHPAPQ